MVGIPSVSGKLSIRRNAPQTLCAHLLYYGLVRLRQHGARPRTSERTAAIAHHAGV